jgi:hypothetical protein
MTYSEPARTAARGSRSTILAALVVVSVALFGVLVGVLGYQSRASSSSSAASPPVDTPHGDPGPAVVGGDSGRPTTEDRGRHGDRDRRDRRVPAAPLGEADGAVPDGVTVFDDDVPAVANLDPDLLADLRRAATDAARDGVELYVTSGWRSPEYQDQLLREAISEYGSEEEAARWVATADTSAHVTGDAVDIGPADATAWLSKHGAEYGLCQVYRNEPWHYEPRPDGSGDGCPPMYADPTQEPEDAAVTGARAEASSA